MSNPIRVQLSRRKGFRLSDAAGNGLPTVKVDRSTLWGNHFRIVAGDDYTFEIRKDGSYREAPLAVRPTLQKARACAVELFRDWALSEFGEHFRRRAVVDLRGKNLACWCPIGGPCHADTLLESANMPEES